MLVTRNENDNMKYIQDFHVMFSHVGIFLSLIEFNYVAYEKNLIIKFSANEFLLRAIY